MFEKPTWVTKSFCRRTVAIAVVASITLGGGAIASASPRDHRHWHGQWDGQWAAPTKPPTTTVKPSPTTTVKPPTPATPTVPATPTTPTSPTDGSTPAGWKVAFDDEFTSSTLNSSMWNVRNNTHNSNENSQLMAANVGISNGALNITAKNQAAGGQNYTSGYVDSNGKYALPDNFRLEIKAKVPLEQGMWAAPVWFRPTDASGGEIDLIETWGADLQKFGSYKVHQTIHTAYGTGHQSSQIQSAFSGDPLAYHTYLIEKTSGQIVEYVDGVKTATFKQGSPSWFDQYYSAGKTWNMRINLQVGGARGLPDSSTDWTKTTMSIDYIKAWTQS